MTTIATLLGPFARVHLAHLPTPLHKLPNLTKALGGPDVYVKRDDCTGLALGGNKARQLEYYFGQALEQGADTILITGAVQSNYARMTAAAARQLGMHCHIQLEERVANVDVNYRRSGNVLLDHIFGASMSSYPQGEDEAGADRRLEEIAAELRDNGRQPYVIHLGPDHEPLGALGYVNAAAEILAQAQTASISIDAIVIASGSSHSHSGLLVGLRALGCDIPVIGVCVRRDAKLQYERVTRCTGQLQRMLELHPDVVTPEDIRVYDGTLAPGYGHVNAAVIDAIRTLAQSEGVLLDPVYTGKSMAGLLALLKSGHFERPSNVLFVHTGGVPALFAYESALTQLQN